MDVKTALAVALLVCSSACTSVADAPETTSLLPLVGNRGTLEQGVTHRYRYYIHCGMKWLEGFNGRTWVTDEPISSGMGDVSDDMRPFLVNPDEVISIELWTHITLVSDDEIHLTLPDGSQSSTYRPTDAEWPGCA